MYKAALRAWRGMQGAVRMAGRQAATHSECGRVLAEASGSHAVVEGSGTGRSGCARRTWSSEDPSVAVVLANSQVEAHRFACCGPGMSLGRSLVVTGGARMRAFPVSRWHTRAHVGGRESYVSVPRLAS